jgi:hypothetical protein
VRNAFDRKQAVIAIERQLSGTAIHDEETKQVLRTEVQMLSEQISLLEKAFTWPTPHSLEDEWARRNTAIKAVTKYCTVPEGGPLRGRPKRAAPSDDGFNQTEPRKRVVSEKLKPESTVPNPGGPFEEAEQHILNAKKPERCFQCFGNRSLPEHKCVQVWSRYDATVRLFQDKHLQDQQCNFCDDGEIFLHQMHFQRHAEAVHRLITKFRAC